MEKTEQKFNLMEFTFEEIENLQDEGEGYYSGKFFGQPVLLRYLGEYNDSLRSVIEKYSYISHSDLTINYGIIVKKEVIGGKAVEKVYVIRELVEGKNFYFITGLEYHNKLIVMYQITCLMEYLHSFDIFYKYLKPQKILIYEDIKVKVLNLLQQDVFELNNIISGPLNDHTRFLCPDLYNPDNKANLEQPFVDIYSIGCHLYYAIFNELPWTGCESKNQILANYLKGDIFLQEGTMKNSYFAEHDPFVVEMVRKCLTKGYNTISELKEDFQSLPEIILYNYEGYRDFDYVTGNFSIK
jgi:serine/threonine protein kinase